MNLYSIPSIKGNKRLRLLSLFLFFPLLIFAFSATAIWWANLAYDFFYRISLIIIFLYPVFVVTSFINWRIFFTGVTTLILLLFFGIGINLWLPVWIKLLPERLQIPFFSIVTVYFVFIIYIFNKNKYAPLPTKDRSGDLTMGCSSTIVMGVVSTLPVILPRYFPKFAIFFISFFGLLLVTGSIYFFFQGFFRTRGLLLKRIDYLNKHA